MHGSGGVHKRTPGDEQCYKVVVSTGDTGLVGRKPGFHLPVKTARPPRLHSLPNTTFTTQHRYRKAHTYLQHAMLQQGSLPYFLDF